MKADEWVWWEAGPDGGYRVGPRDVGALAVVFTVDEARALCKNANARSSEIGVRISPDLYRRILEQHELAAEALVDSHGDVHREIVAALKNAAPQEPRSPLKAATSTDSLGEAVGNERRNPASAAPITASSASRALVEACRGLISYWTRNLRNFQWEKADEHVKRINIALGELDALPSSIEPIKSALHLARTALQRWTHLYAKLQNESGEIVSRKLDYNLPPAEHVKALEAIDAALMAQAVRSPSSTGIAPVTETLLSEMVEAWFSSTPTEPMPKRDDEPRFFERMERVYSVIAKRSASVAREEKP